MASLEMVWPVMTPQQKLAAIGYARTLENLASSLNHPRPQNIPAASTMNEQTPAASVAQWAAWYSGEQGREAWLPPLGPLTGDGLTNPTPTSPASWSALVTLSQTRDGTPQGVRAFMSVQGTIWQEIIAAFGSRAQDAQIVQAWYQRWWFERLGGANQNTGTDPAQTTTQTSQQEGSTIFGIDSDTLLKLGLGYLLFRTLSK